MSWLNLTGWILLALPVAALVRTIWREWHFSFVQNAYLDFAIVMFMILAGGCYLGLAFILILR